MEKLQFNPKVNYEWAADSQVVLTGKEYEVLYKNIKAFVSGNATDIGNIAKVIDTYAILQAKLKALVEEGIAKEVNF